MKRCATPGCRHKDGHGDTTLFCPPCADKLARVRDEIKAEGGRMQGSNNNWFKRSGGRAATCCTPGCFKIRIPPEAFCLDCADDRGGVAMEDAA